jgi:8-oxo-dGTP diphosphatase
MNKAIHVQARAVIIKDEHILLCRTKNLNPDFYFLPGGHIEHGESACNALIRELQEELGFKFKILRFLGCMEYSFNPEVINHAKCHTHEYSFIFEVESAQLLPPSIQLTQIEDGIEILWVPLETFVEVDFRPKKLRVSILEWLNSSFNKALVTCMA